MNMSLNFDWKEQCMYAPGLYIILKSSTMPRVPIDISHNFSGNCLLYLFAGS